MKKYMDFFENGQINGQAYLAYLNKVLNAFKENFVPNPDLANGGPRYLPNFRDKRDPSFDQLSQAYIALQAEVQRQIDQNAFDADALSQLHETFDERINAWKAEMGDAAWQHINWGVMNYINKDIEGEEPVNLNYFVSSLSGASLWKRQVTVHDNQFEKGSLNEMKSMGQDEPLFPEGSPRKEDVLQDTSGSCYMLSGLRMLAQYTPDFIRSRMIDNGDNTVTVYFQEFGPVTVDKSYPRNLDKSAAPWVRILEKAYVVSHLKNMDRQQHIIPNNVYHMKNLLWGQESGFFNDFLPVKEVMTHSDIAREPNRYEARRRLKSALLNSKGKRPAIVISTNLHAISVEDVVEQDDKVYLKLFDQWRRNTTMVDVDSLLDNKTPYKEITVINTASTPAEQIYIDTETLQSDYNAYEQPLTEEAFVNNFSKKFSSVVRENMRFEPALTRAQNTQIKNFLSNSEAIKNALKEEFAKLDPLLTEGDLEMMSKKGSPFLVEMYGKITKTAVQELQSKLNDPLLSDLKNKLSSPEETRRCFEGSLVPDPNAHKPFPKTPAEMDSLRGKLDRLYSDQETERISRIDKNSVEFEAMTDALRDLSCVMSDPNADKTVVKALQERAYMKCNYYQKNKNPISPYGKRRKNAALDAMKAIEEMNPTVRSDVYSKNGKEMLVEMACMCAKNELQPEMNRYKNINDSLQNMGRLKEGISRFLDNPVLQRLSESFKYTGSENGMLIEKLCQKESVEVLKDFMSRKIPGVAPEWHKELTDDHMERTLNVKLNSQPEAPEAPQVENVFHM